MPKKDKYFLEKISDRFKSAANLIHLLVYDPKSLELIYSYSTHGVKLSDYLVNAILESVTMHEGIELQNQEIHLRDGGSLILNDGEYVRVAMVSRETPSVEMLKQLLCFQGELELKIEREFIPKWGQDLKKILRFTKFDFANDLIELCFQKSLISQHVVIEPKEQVKLNKFEYKILEIARRIRSKSGPFLLQRIIARCQTELSPIPPLPKILEAVYNLKSYGYLRAVSEKDAQKMKEDLYKSQRPKRKEETKAEHVPKEKK
ncbi:MAG: hypothetical protein ACTSRW_14615 [Candidatus Helarchaeota archaeon]